MKANAADKVRSEIWKRGLDRIGIQIVFETGNHADNLKEATACKLMMRPSAWLPDIRARSPRWSRAAVGPTWPGQWRSPPSPHPPC